MSKHQLQNERLDRLERKLLEATRVNSEEIEKIVAAPQLFDRVKARIRAEEQSKRKQERFFGKWASLLFLRGQRAIIAYGILIVSITCAAVIIFKKEDSRQIAERLIEHQIQPQITRTEKAENLLLPAAIKETSKQTSKETKTSAAKKLVNAERTAFKPVKPNSPNRMRMPDQLKPQSKVKNLSQEVFYSLAGNWEANGEDLQIVRTEISTSELFALGIHLPAENETAKIKTDLLVGTDGVARAIRFVE